MTSQPFDWQKQADEAFGKPVVLDPCCANCRWWAMWSPDIWSHQFGACPAGECHAHAPQKAAGAECQWPTTYMDNWCGEFQPIRGEEPESMIFLGETIIADNPASVYGHQ